MKASNPLHLSLPQPCHENWTDMAAADSGRFCQSCQKCVVDFTGYSDRELVEYFRKAHGPVCGRLNPQQLNRTLYAELPATNRMLWPRLLLGAWLLGGITTGVQAQRPLPAKQHPSNPSRLPVRPQTADPSPAPSSIRHISGRVHDAENGEPLIGASVLLTGANIGTFTDAKGEFTLVIPNTVAMADSYTLVFNYAGYGKTEKTVPAVNLPADLYIALPDGMLGIVGGISYYNYMPTFWQRIRHWLSIGR